MFFTVLSLVTLKKYRADARSRARQFTWMQTRKPGFRLYKISRRNHAGIGKNQGIHE
jgi:hypothetical protein